MSMAEPFVPHPEEADTALDEHRDAPVQEPHGEPAEANDTLTSAGRAHDDQDRTPLFGKTEGLRPEELAAETPE